MYLPSERMSVDDNGLGFSFNIGKAISRAVTVTKTSFQPKNILGAIGSVAANIVTFGAASVFAPKTFGAHSKTMKQVGIGVLAAVAVVGGVVAGPIILAAIGPAMSSAVTMLGTAGSGLMGVASKFGNFFRSKPVEVQTAIAQNITPEQIVGLEQGTISPNVYLDSLQAKTGIPMAQYKTAGMFGDMSNTTMLALGGLTIAGLVIQLLRKKE